MIADRRMETARHLLGKGKSVKAVARDLGFGSPAGFTYAFRRCTGVTPRQFRTRGNGAGHSVIAKPSPPS